MVVMAMVVVVVMVVMTLMMMVRIWIWFECNPPRLHLLKLHPHGEALRGWKLNPTMVFRGGAFRR
jgi:hypothetical protein